MKKITIMFLLIALTAGAFIACGTKSPSVEEGVNTPIEKNDAVTDISIDDILKLLNDVKYKDSDAVLNSLSKEIDVVLSEIEEEYNNVINDLGSDYATLSKNFYKIYDWFDHSKKESERVYTLFITESRTYYLLLAAELGPKQSLYPKDKLYEMFNIVYAAFNDIYMSIYNKNAELWNKAYPLLDQASNEYTQFKEARTEFMNSVLDDKNNYYNDFNGLYQSVREEFSNGSIDILKYY